MQTRPFVEVIKEQLDSETLNLPMFHPIAIKLQGVLAAKDFTIEQVVALIIKDQALTSQILRLANSAFFSGLAKVTTITEAVVRMGAREIASKTATTPSPIPSSRTTPRCSGGTPSAAPSAPGG